MEIRTHYTTLYEGKRREGVTQRQIADRGGLSGPNPISKLLANEFLGPSVETFVRAVHGLGYDIAGFFATMDRGAALPSPPSGPFEHERIANVEAMVRNVVEAVLQINLLSSPASHVAPASPAALASVAPAPEGSYVAPPVLSIVARPVDPFFALRQQYENYKQRAPVAHAQMGSVGRPRVRLPRAKPRARAKLRRRA